MKKIILVISIAVLLVFIYFMYPNVNHNTNKFLDTNNPKKLLNNELVHNIKDNNNSKKFTNDEFTPDFFADTDLKQEYLTLFINHEIDKQIVFLENIIDNGEGDPVTYLMLLESIEDTNSLFNSDSDRIQFYDKYFNDAINKFPESQIIKCMKLVNESKNNNPEIFEKEDTSELDKYEKKFLKLLQKSKSQNPKFIEQFKFYDPEGYERYKDYLK